MCHGIEFVEEQIELGSKVYQDTLKQSVPRSKMILLGSKVCYSLWTGLKSSKTNIVLGRQTNGFFAHHFT